MSQKEIIVTVERDGQVAIEASGFQGQGCTKATEQLEIALGGGPQKQKRKPKPDFYATHSGSNFQRN